jgi:hypothetical protein
VNEAALGFLFRQSQRPLIRFARLRCSTQPTAEVGARGVSEVVAGQVAIRQDVVDQG